LRRYIVEQLQLVVDQMRELLQYDRVMMYQFHEDAHGRAVQVDPIKPMLKAPGYKRLKLNYDRLLSILLSNFAFKFNLRRYSTGR